MKAFLMHRDRDLALDRELTNADLAVIQDLELETLLGAMAGGDQLIHDVATQVLLTGLQAPGEIRYRQDALRDCLAHPEVVRDMYALAVEAIQVARRDQVYGTLRRSPDIVLSRSQRVLTALSESLARLRAIAEENVGTFSSDGLTRLFAELIDQLDDEYLAELRAQLQELQFPGGTLISARLGVGNRSVDHVLRRPRRRTWSERLSLTRTSYSFRLAPRDDAGAQILGELRARGINQVANALAQAADHLLSYFALLRAELAFYVGCLNLHDRLAAKGEPLCLPEPTAAGEPALTCEGLYDPCLSLHLDERVVGNDLDGDGRLLVVVTGANQGGKSTFLRSIGLAQLMMQAGMFVPAASFRADTRRGTCTHFKREEDAGMRSGKLDEELRRMSAIVEDIQPGALLLCNESFASTNEREGSEIARQLLRALGEVDVKVVFVTHMYDLAHGLFADASPRALFLRAERLEDSRRTFRVVPGEPLETSYGEDLYRRIFGGEPGAQAPTDRKTTARLA